MSENRNKTRVLLKGMHLAYVNRELVLLLRKEFSIQNFVSWAKEQANTDFGFQLEEKEDIQMLQRRVALHGFDTIGEWLDCVMREQLGLWPPNKKRKELNMNGRDKWVVSMASIGPWSMENLSVAAEGYLRDMLHSNEDFELKGGLENGGDITMKVFSAGDAISVHAIHCDGRGPSSAATANKALPRTASYEQVLSLMREKRDALTSILRERNVIYDSKGFVTDRVKIETDDVAVLMEKASGMIAYSSIEKLFPAVEDIIIHLLALEKDGVPVEFQVSGYAKKENDVELTIKAEYGFISLLVEYDGAYQEKRGEVLPRSASFQEIIRTVRNLHDAIFPDGYIEMP